LKKKTCPSHKKNKISEKIIYAPTTYQLGCYCIFFFKLIHRTAVTSRTRTKLVMDILQCFLVIFDMFGGSNYRLIANCSCNDIYMFSYHHPRKATYKNMQCNDYRRVFVFKSKSNNHCSSQSFDIIIFNCPGTCSWDLQYQKQKRIYNFFLWFQLLWWGCSTYLLLDFFMVSIDMVGLFDFRTCFFEGEKRLLSS
jgi:hypothetical protein